MCTSEASPLTFPPASWADPEEHLDAAGSVALRLVCLEAEIGEQPEHEVESLAAPCARLLACAPAVSGDALSSPTNLLGQFRAPPLRGALGTKPEVVEVGDARVEGPGLDRPSEGGREPVEGARRPG